jgi:hypothetical protein
MLVTMDLSVASKVTSAPNVVAEPTKLALGCLATSFSRVPVGTVPDVILALSVLFVVRMTDVTKSLVVESDLLVSMDWPAFRWSKERFMTPALTLRRETSGMPSDNVVVEVLVSTAFTVCTALVISESASTVNIPFLKDMFFLLLVSVGV